MSDPNAANENNDPALVPVSPAPLIELVLDSLASEHSRSPRQLQLPVDLLG
ncbi:MAG: hypothetical protein OXC11_04890 [Rhodospirillales bacterium]|nr:hypothetical protein [Rhodospirillales bacterium]